MKDIIKKLIEKLTCCHDWEMWRNVTVTKDLGERYQVYHLKCLKCGKLKKIKSF